MSIPQWHHLPHGEVLIGETPNYKDKLPKPGTYRYMHSSWSVCVSTYETSWAYPFRWKRLDAEEVPAHIRTTQLLLS